MLRLIPSICTVAAVVALLALVVGPDAAPIWHAAVKLFGVLNGTPL
jgi:hypothetical protein